MNNKWLIFIGTSLMVLLANIDATIVNLALATIAKDLHTNLSQIQWIINSYLLTAVIFFIIAGKLSDIFGQKKVFLFGTLIFGISSFIAGIAPNFSVLIVARLLQGIGFAFTLSIAFLMISNAFPVEQRGFVLGLAMTITGLGQALGPTLGGVILDELNWNWIFFINVPIALLSFFFILTFDHSKEKPREEKIDYLGGFLLGAFLTILLLTITAHDLTKENYLAGILASALFFILFCWKENKTTFPLINFQLFQKRDYLLSIIIRFLFMYIYGIFLFLIPLYLQNMREYSPLVSGLMLLVYSSLLAIFSPMAGIWNDQVGYKIPIIFSGFVCLLTFLILSYITTETTISLVLLGLAIFGITTGIMIPSTVHSTISSLPKKNTGEGLGMFFTVAFVGASLGVAISGAQLNAISTQSLNSAPISKVLSPADFNLLHLVGNGTQSLQRLESLNQNATALKNVAKESFTKGFSSVMRVNVILTFIMILLSILLTKRSKLEKKSDSTLPLEL